MGECLIMHQWVSGVAMVMPAWDMVPWLVIASMQHSVKCECVNTSAQAVIVISKNCRFNSLHNFNILFHGYTVL